MATTMKYGGYTFEPVPIVNIQQNRIKTGDGIDRGVTFVLSLTGTLTEMSESAGIASLMTKVRELREAFDRDGKYFAITCDETVILECYPRIISIELNESSNNWVFTIPYTITIEYENEPADQNISGNGEHEGLLHPPYISNFSEDWSVEFVPDETNPHNFNGEPNNYAVRVSHNVSAVGKSHYAGISGAPAELTGTLDKPAWQQARDYVKNYLGFDNDIFLGLYTLNLPTGSIWSNHDHMRVMSIGETDGSYSVQENWLVLGNRSGTGATSRKAIEDFTIDVQKGQNQEFYSVAIQGSIRGLEDRTYGTGAGEFTITNTKYSNAENYFTAISGSLSSRVGAIASVYSIDNLNLVPVTETIGYSPNQGSINYNYVYDTRPGYCLTGLDSLGLRYESINIDDTYPTDVFASLTIIGRQKGPILQDLNTVTEATRTVSIELLVDTASTCTATGMYAVATTIRNEVDPLISGFGADFNSRYDMNFNTQNSESWSPKTGRYSRVVGWSGTKCALS